MIAGRRKSTDYVCLIRPTRASIAAIGKLGVPSVSVCYGAADMFTDDRIFSDSTDQHAKQMPLPGELYQRRIVFKLLTTKFTEATEKSVFRENDHLTEKFQNFAAKGFADTWIYDVTYSSQVSRKSVKRK